MDRQGNVVQVKQRASSYPTGIGPPVDEQGAAPRTVQARTFSRVLQTIDTLSVKEKTTLLVLYWGRPATATTTTTDQGLPQAQVQVQEQARAQDPWQVLLQVERLQQG